MGEPGLNASPGSLGSTETVRICLFEAIYSEVHSECSGVRLPGSNSVSLGKFANHTLSPLSPLQNGENKTACFLRRVSLFQRTLLRFM